MDGGLGRNDTSTVVVKASGAGFRPSDGPDPVCELLAAIDGHQRVRMPNRSVRRQIAKGNIQGLMRKPVVRRAAPDPCIGVPASTEEPGAATAGEPHPSEAAKPVPRAAVIGPPAPRIAGDPRVTDGVVVAPVALAERIPVCG